MFEGLHKRPNKSVKIKPISVLTVRKVHELLDTPKRQEHLKNIRSLLNLPPKLYDLLYGRVIERFAEFVQEIPETQRGIFSHTGGFLDHGIERAARALGICLTYFFPEQKSFQDISSEQSLWVYAVFTASLLLDVGKIAVKYDIAICEKDGVLVKPWLPYSGTLVSQQAKFYKFEFVTENLERLRKLITGILARQILSEFSDVKNQDTSIGGFNWIASDRVVLEAWLSLLAGENRTVNPFLNIIPIADAQVIDNYISNIHNQNEDLNVQALDQAKDFLKWLQDGISDGKISVNQADSLIHTTEDGALISQEAFEKYAVLMGLNVQDIENKVKQYAEVYESYMADMGQRHSYIGGLAQQNAWKGMLIHNISLLFMTGNHPAIHSQFIAKGSAKPVVVVPPPINPMQKQAPNVNIRPR